MCAEKLIFIKKYVDSGQKTVHKVETHRLSGNEKVPGEAATKDIILINFLDMKGPISDNLFEKGATLNSVSYCLLPRHNQPSRLGGWGSVEYINCIFAESYDPSNECPGYDTKQSDGEAPVMLELWGM